MKGWKWGVLAVSLFLMFGNALLPNMFGLERMGMASLCIFVGTMLLMVLCNLIWPLFLAIIALVLNGVYTFNQALSLSLGHNLMWFVVFSCMVLYVLRESGVLRRIAIYLISRPIARKSPWLFVASIFAATILMACIMDCTALIILYCSVLEQIFVELDIKKGDRFAELMTLGVMICVGVGYGATPIGHTIAILAMGQLEPLAPTSFGYFIVVGVIMAVLFFFILLAAMKFVFRLDVSKLQGYDPASLSASLPPMSKEEKVSVTIFVAIIIWWLLPTFIQNSMPGLYSVLNGLSLTTPLWVAMLIMILVPVNGKPLMDFEKCINEGVAWPACFSMAVAMMLGSVITNPDAGVSDMLGRVLSPLFGAMSPVVLVLIMGVLAMLITNFASNTVATMLSCTIALALIGNGTVTGVYVPALAVVIGNCACFAYMTPPAGTYAAYTSGTGWVTPKAMFAIGGGFAVLFSVLFSVAGYQIGMLLA